MLKTECILQVLKKAPDDDGLFHQVKETLRWHFLRVVKNSHCVPSVPTAFFCYLDDFAN